MGWIEWLAAVLFVIAAIGFAAWVTYLAASK
jgi:hypothetical protein